MRRKAKPGLALSQPAEIDADEDERIEQEQHGERRMESFAPCPGADHAQCEVDQQREDVERSLGGEVSPGP